jgi:hypothetical protein
LVRCARQTDGGKDFAMGAKDGSGHTADANLAFVLFPRVTEAAKGSELSFKEPLRSNSEWRRSFEFQLLDVLLQL